MDKDLGRYVDAVLEHGKSMHSQAKAAGVDTYVIQRLVHADPRYEDAVAAGRVKSGAVAVKKYTDDELRELGPLMDAVERRITQAEAAKRLGVHPLTVSKWVKRVKDAPIELPAFLRRSSADNPLEGELGVFGQKSNVELADFKIRELPIISWVRASYWGDASDPYQPGDPEGIEGYVPCLKPTSSSAYVLRVVGDSMTSPAGNKHSYPDGSLIFVEPEKRLPVNGDRVIAKLKGSDSVTFKIYKNEDGRQWLMPLNPQHPPIYDEFSILGTVIGGWVD